MLARLFAPATPADELRAERERVAKRRPHLAFAAPEPKAESKPQRDPFAWVSIADLLPVEDEP